MIKSKLGYQALLAILLGVLAGLFFGPKCAVLKPIGDIFIIVLQIVVIPYIPSLLMHGLGSLTPELAKKLLRNGWPFLVLLWILVLVVCYIVKVIIPVPLPNPSTDFSIEKSAIVSGGYGLLTPGASLYGLFNNLIPGIALFSLLFGLAIMHLKEKEPLLGFLDRVNCSIDRIIKWITIVSPIGIFAHIAHVMGTINFDDLAKLQLYILMVIGVTLYLSLWVLPVLISCLTSIPLKEIFMEFRIVAFLPFATGIPTLALPYINNAMRRLAERKKLVLGTFRSTSQTIIPIGFGFAQIGNFIPLLFIFFLAFFYRHPFTDLQSIGLPFLITLFSIGTPQFTFVALPYLLNILDLPAEGFNLYAEISAITLNFQVLLSTTSMLTFMYLVILKYYGLLQVHWRKLMYHGATTVGFLLAFSFIGKNYIHTEDNYHNLYYNLSMSDAINNPPKVTVFTERAAPPSTTIDNTLARILDRKILRVGYDIRNIPFCYLNLNNAVVGYDIAYAYQLAKDLNVSLELLPIDYESLADDINSGYFDIVMSAILMDESRIVKFQFSDPYSEQHNVLLVPRNRRGLFRNMNQLIASPSTKIAAVGGYQDVVNLYFPRNLYPVFNLDEFLKSGADALMWSELPAYIWCLAHPEFTTVSFNHTLGKNYFAYPCSVQSEQFIHFINEWLDLKKQQGFELKQRQYWFLGKSQTPEDQRWSIMRDVLHWTK
jgi:proton glutamate symport protein